MPISIYRTLCGKQGCHFLNEWKAIAPEDILMQRCPRCRAVVCIHGNGSGTFTAEPDAPSATIKVKQINTLGEAMLLWRNRRVTFTPQQGEALEKIWKSAEEQDLLVPLFNTLMYIGSYASGARFISVEDARTPHHLSMEFVGLDKNGGEFIHIGAVYRPDERTWSFHS